MMELARPIIAIVGPTGVGKSTIAQSLAQQQGTSVLSADSMQVYKGMDIGTAKVMSCEQVVPHFGIDLVEPSHSYSAAEYQKYARMIIEREAADSGGVTPIVCGGTGLYLRAALDDFVFPEQAENADHDGSQFTETRQRYEDQYAQMIKDCGGAENPDSKIQAAMKMHDLLAQCDKEAADHIHPNNVRRVIRALELHGSGQSYADIKQAFKERRSYYPAVWIGIDCERDLLYQRIEHRVDDMMQHGLLQEVDTLLQAGYRDASTAQQAIGYKELVPVLEGSADMADAVAAIKQATRRYAKRQLSWFRGDPRVQWIRNDDVFTAEVVEHALKIAADYNCANRKEGE
ncbi:MAG: tRNA (adenosine(37)-N6)-dimethylallyltransferase MiaA [Coriobacteriia bacterium]|nr:tRNA (adenosine(37)-N6)-dimethylallyltransferase MiaA [Coriobacteriia bacterium]